MKNKLFVIEIIAIFFMILLNAMLFAQAPATQWLKTFGGINEDSGNSVQQTSDGGYIIIGNTHSFGAGHRDVWLIRTDNNGDTLWTKTFGGSEYDLGNSIQQTSDGGYIITGSTNSFGASGSDIWLIKTNGNGDTLWTKTFGGNDDQGGNSIQQTSDGGFIITGYSRNDLWLIKTDSGGDTLWTKTFGGNAIDCGNSVQQTSDGGYIITGTYENMGEVSGDVCLIKTDGNGDTLWTKTFGLEGYPVDFGTSVQQTSDGGYIITGLTESFGTDFLMNVLLLKINAEGEMLWNKAIGRNHYEVGNSVHQTSDGGYIITGLCGLYGDDVCGGDVWLIKTDSSGDTLWTKAFGGSEWEIGRSVRQTTDGGYILTGETVSFGAGSSDVWLIKVAPDITATEKKPHSVINEYQLHQNYPNPFNPSTVISYQLPVSSQVELSIYNLLGQKIATLVSEQQSAGIHKINFDARGLASGMYLYRLEAAYPSTRSGQEFVQVKKLILMR